MDGIDTMRARLQELRAEMEGDRPGYTERDRLLRAVLDEIEARARLESRDAALSLQSAEINRRAGMSHKVAVEHARQKWMRACAAESTTISVLTRVRRGGGAVTEAQKRDTSQAGARFWMCECCGHLMVTFGDDGDAFQCPQCAAVECGHGGRYLEMCREEFAAEVGMEPL